MHSQRFLSSVWGVAEGYLRSMQPPPMPFSVILVRFEFHVQDQTYVGWRLVSHGQKQM